MYPLTLDQDPFVLVLLVPDLACLKLQKRHPEEYKELEEIARKSLLAAEEPEVYHLIPKGYLLDRSDSDVLVLRRDDKMRTFVAVFSPTGVSPQGVLDAIREDRERRGC